MSIRRNNHSVGEMKFGEMGFRRNGFRRNVLIPFYYNIGGLYNCPSPTDSKKINNQSFTALLFALDSLFSLDSLLFALYLLCTKIERMIVYKIK
ncbi:hypothetical protein GLOIN_2v1558188 [Rhizophagus irregularis DAOM 181602=DAOM 197198]|uniref:Uncharacterized protein n=1 Tax=Rhizophagus irregularis (strain DAOM 181602 / DAOM 197198 / MUCL 43194) TaxID=747089 RepID=A0A2P4QF84_RHIID|nr:hypothetical protein GLOIN_2v1558188 [Rhizophagus irregularis DAOM 181602=DAOM 197198]POG76280.1 hypothetical protein GLOIN_2v1558188 [Rhizophagus irregularis DAOM 181602=DAOM 197198]GET53149.1 hypothetical protein GLOIN_2v1558188 [Rhizophagus irregularis DAOM 181602=DAOM 197198]|eukprot:XP_025183146.1 hypothetical protein GLOIN_2v1558188 [Rhizophagus irregularis DAOM 181602=DAOM 197198]